MPTTLSVGGTLAVRRKRVLLLTGFAFGLSCMPGVVLAQAPARTAGAPAAPAGTGVWSDDDRDATAYVLGKAAGQRTMTLDLSDPKVARYLKRQYELSGMTADRYPGLHALMSEQAKRMAVEGPPKPRTTAVSDDILYQDTATVMLALYANGTANGYTANGAASFEQDATDPQMLQLAYTSLCFFDANNQPIGSCVTNNSFGAGQYFPVNNTLVTPNQAFTAALAATYYQPSTGRYLPQLSTLSADSIDPPQDQTITGPVIVNMSTNKNFGAAQLCVSRAVSTPVAPGGALCDYGTFTNSDVVIKIGGTITYGANQSPPVDAASHLIGTASLSLLNIQQGGQCILSPTLSGGFFAQPQVTYANKTLTWAFNSLDFGPGNNLVCGGSGTNILYNLVIQTKDTANGGNTIVASQLSVGGTTVPTFSGPSKMALATPVLNVVTGCLDPETLITMGGPTGPRRRSIRSLAGAGELVRSNHARPLQLVGSVTGTDAELFVVRARNGMTVRATAKHPFVTADGRWRAAEELKAGDLVRTERGVSRIATVDRVHYGGKVYNLVLGRPLTTPPTPANDGFYANGFLVGGWGAQEALAAERRARPERVRAVIPAQFRQDYESHLQDRAHSSGDGPRHPD